MGRGRRHLHWPPLPSACTPIPWSPGGERLDPLCQHSGCPQVCRSAGTQHPACMDLVQITWVLVDRTSETKQSFPEDSPTSGGCGHLPLSYRRLAWLLPWSSLGAGRPRSPPSGMQSLLRMCACGCVCVFIRMLLKKQPSLWGSWTLHVRVSPESLACCPLPRALFSPPTQQPAFLFPAEKRIVGNSRTLPTHPPVPACWDCLHALPRARGTPYPFPFPLLTKEKKEFQTTTRLCGLASYPKLCCQLALCGGRAQTEPRTEGYPPVPHCSYVLLSFHPQYALESFPYPRLFP